jgi:hypothetical protein
VRPDPSPHQTRYHGPRPLPRAGGPCGRYWLAVLVLIVLEILLTSLAAEAQQAAKLYRVAFLGSTSPSGHANQMEAFRGGLRDLGYAEGQKLVIESRWAQGKYERLPELN